jgi:hypothetical protein
MNKGAISNYIKGFVQEPQKQENNFIYIFVKFNLSKSKRKKKER